jgi:hypothetical protein
MRQRSRAGVLVGLRLTDVDAFLVAYRKEPI